jgi:hypothetical protein
MYGIVKQYVFGFLQLEVDALLFHVVYVLLMLVEIRCIYSMIYLLWMWVFTVYEVNLLWLFLSGMNFRTFRYDWAAPPLFITLYKGEDAAFVRDSHVAFSISPGVYWGVQAAILGNDSQKLSR